MSRGFIVDDMIAEVRSLVDEFNENQVGSATDILPSLNRAQERAVKVLSRVYPDPIMNMLDIAGPNTREIAMLENVSEDKIVRIEWISSGVNSVPVECQRVGIRLLSQYEHGMTAVDRPECYAIYGRMIRFNGIPNGRSALRIWYIREIDPLVQAYARITDFNLTAQTLYIGEVSDTFDPAGSITQGDWIRCFNVVDGQTGEIRGSFEASGYVLGSDTLTINLTPTRTTVLNRAISDSLADITFGVDDYICPIRGTCVQYFMDALHAFCIQYSVAELKRKLGYAYDADQTLVADFEGELKKTSMGRSMGLRVTQNNPNWLRGSQRRFYRGFKY